jgi:hypothetical protein
VPPVVLEENTGYDVQEKLPVNDVLQNVTRTPAVPAETIDMFRCVLMAQKGGVPKKDAKLASG